MTNKKIKIDINFLLIYMQIIRKNTLIRFENRELTMSSELRRNLNDVTIYDKLNIDIIKYILFLNYKKRTYAANVIQKTTKIFIKNKLKNIDLCIRSPGSGTFYINKEYKYNILNYKNIIRTANACKCCARHQINKPKTFKKQENLPISQEHHDNFACKCACRQLSRYICRLID
jgi:hypothetical protein